MNGNKINTYTPPDPDTLHDRVRESVSEQRKLLTSLSTGSIGVFLISLTGKSEFSGFQKWAMGFALVFMSLSLFAGIISWHTDAKRNYFWARELLEKGERNKKRFCKSKKHWSIVSQISSLLLRTFFILGIISVVCFIASKIDII